MSRVGLFVCTMSVHQEIYVRHQQERFIGLKTANPLLRQPLRSLPARGHAPLAVPQGHHPETSWARALLGGGGAPETLAEGILNQTAKRDSGCRRGSFGPPEYVIIELDRSPHKNEHKDAHAESQIS